MKVYLSDMTIEGNPKEVVEFLSLKNDAKGNQAENMVSTITSAQNNGYTIK